MAMKGWKYPAILIVVFVILWLAGYMIYLSRVIGADIDNPTHKSDAIIVLTGGSKRIDTGVKLLREGRAAHLLISGVDTQVSRADVLSQHRLSESLRACCVILGRQARDTPGNARETYDWIQDNDIASLRLVTSHYHIDRAWLEFSTTMPDIRIYKHPVRPANLDFRDTHFWRLTFEEYHKLLYRIGFHFVNQFGNNKHQGDISS